MGADIFESYCGSVIATIFIGSTLASNATSAMILPIQLSQLVLWLQSWYSSMNALKGIDPAWALRLAPVVGIVGLFTGAYFAVDAMDLLEHFHTQWDPMPWFLAL